MMEGRPRKRGESEPKAEAAPAPLRKGDTIILHEREGGTSRWKIVAVGSGKRE
jgi:hypothetical protein